MTYQEAVQLAKAGEERGFGFLYQNTYKSKYYLALQYMKNEEAAQDVLQDAYIRAFSHLDSLKDPENFPAWLGTIVANTAKNMLTKKNPMLFSDLPQEEEGEIEYEIEDDNLEYRPEAAYTRQETRELVHELMDSLSEEQRLCILMYHIEGRSIREIAQVLNCSENTVKSRLNYGRKNLRMKAEMLQKKGYKLYSLAPVPLLLYLLREDAAAMSGGGLFAEAGQYTADQVFSRLSLRAGREAGCVQYGMTESAQNASHAAGYGQQGAAGAGKMQGAAKGGIGAAGKAAAGHAASGVVKSGILHTVTGKVLVAVIGVCAVSGIGLFGAAQIQRNTRPETEVVQEKEPVEETRPQQEETEKDQESQASQETPRAEQTPEPQGPTEMMEADYSSKIAGNLTKEELEFVLAYGPEEIPQGGFQGEDYPLLMNTLCQGSDAAGAPIAFLGTDGNGRYHYSLADVNRLFSSFTTFQYSEENDSDEEYGVNVEGAELVYVPATMGFSCSAEVTMAQYTDEEMDIYYDFRKSGYETGNTTVSKLAVLRPDETGKYRIVSIQEAPRPAAAATTGETGAQAQSGTSMEEIYRGVLQSVQNQEAGYDFPSSGGAVQGYQYFVRDINGDGIQDLVVGAQVPQNRFIMVDCRVFSCTQAQEGYTLKVIGGDVLGMAFYLAADGNGLFTTNMSMGNGETDAYRVSIQNDTLVQGSSEYQYIMGSAQESQFQASNPPAPWKDISDPNILG